MDLKTNVGDATVSTVRLPDQYAGWAQLDRGAKPASPYETLVFRGGRGDHSTHRTYDTESEARAGHDIAVVRERKRQRDEAVRP